MARKRKEKSDGADTVDSGVMTTEECPPSDGFPVVGIGSSAGGLEALEAFFSHAPSDENMAFIIVPHLDPYHPSILGDLISRRTDMEVFEAVDGMKVEPRRVYVIPPGKDMTISDHTLKLFQRTKEMGPTMPIDLFFRSLAEDKGLLAIAVVLSGTGSDGSGGLKSIQANLGMVMVQSPDTAKYDGMPRSAIATGLADYVLPPAEMPAQISKYLNDLRAKIKDQKVIGPPQDTETIMRILRILKKETGHDFSQYKKNTINRRIERRMSVHQIQEKGEYANFLGKSSEEVKLLFKDLLIEVTRFFRDPEAFQALKEKLKESFLALKGDDKLFRVWVPGCSTGEEAYTMAMVIQEAMDETERHLTVQVFGTDIDESAINTARAGEYPASIAVDIDPKRLERFFIRSEDKLKIRKEVREMVVFAPQDVTRDPPFIRLDLISCRNLLIYFESSLQRKVLETFNFALVPNGILFLGPSESVGGFIQEYTIVDSKWKIYQRIPYTTPYPLHEINILPSAHEFPQLTLVDNRATSLISNAKTILLSDYSDPAVVVNDRDEVVYFHGRTGKYIEHPTGNATLDIHALIKDDLRFLIMGALRDSRSTKQPVVKLAARSDHGEGSTFLNIVVTPLKEATLPSARIIVFQEVMVPNEMMRGTMSPAEGSDRDEYLVGIQRELEYTRENLQSTIEELETSNEELKSMNEELQSTNEELQSVAEESETAKEELHSLNEELMSVNSELERRNQELSASNSDMKNLLNSIDVATIFLDRNMRIRRFTSQTEKMMNMLPTDVGRPVEDMALSMKYKSLVKDAREVLNRLTTIEKEVRTEDDHWYSVRILPYKTVDDIIDGVVITFVDITVQKKAQERLEMLTGELRGAKTYAESIVNNIRQPLAVLDKDLKVQSVNVAFLRAFEVSQGDIEGKSIEELGNGWESSETQTQLKEVLNGRGRAGFINLDLTYPGVGRRMSKVSVRRIVTPENSSSRMLLAFDDMLQQP